MISVSFWLSLVLFLELRNLLKPYKLSFDTQTKKKNEILDFLDQMRSYLGLSTFKRIVILSSLIINGIYIFYYFTSALVINLHFYVVLNSFLLLYRIFKISDTLDIDFEKIDFVEEEESVLSIRSILIIMHAIITLIFILN